MEDKDRLIQYCVRGLKSRDLREDERYLDRLKQELRQIDQQGEYEYFLNLRDKFQKENLVFPYNETNSLVGHLMGLCDDFDIESPYVWVQGEMPDIDTDYIDIVRDYLKKDWAPRTFGREKVCEIGTYGTLGIKQAMLDVTRVYGVSKDEIQSITVEMADKDDEGKPLEWDVALNLYPKFKDFCDRYPDIAKSAHALLDRNKSGGVHAAGLIISNVDIAGFVPLEVRSVKAENPLGTICSAWTEGQGAQDLQPVGFVKFDLLVIANLMQIALACKLVKERHGVEHISNLPGLCDWSDTKYLHDPKALALANSGDTKCIFQLEGEGMRRLLKRGGVTRFDDIVAYTSIYRPGPLSCGMDALYCKRKRGQESYDLHPAVEPILSKTYGIMVYQEQVTDILRVVGKIPDTHTEKVRKAISKKKIDQFRKYKEMFVKNGQEVLMEGEEYLRNLWDQIEAFAGYGFNASHATAYSYISARLLYLKAYYPLEFFAAILMCEKDDKKFKEYKVDARSHGVTVNPVHINKSKQNFSIIDGMIYFGFQNIKGIGEAVSQRIVDGQPYKDFPDFLDRFGTDASVLKPLIALGVFEEQYDRVTLRKFYEYYKEQIKKRKDRQKRHQESMAKRDQELEGLLLTAVEATDPDYDKLNQFTPEAFALWEQRFANVARTTYRKVKGQTVGKPTTLLALLQTLAQKRQDSIDDQAEKDKLADAQPLTLDGFDSSLVELDRDELHILENEISIGGIKGYPEAEIEHYGFQWVHELEASPDYDGYTIDRFLSDVERQKELNEADPQAEPGKGVVGCIEVVIRKFEKRLAKNNKTEFVSLTVEDANGKQMKVTVWMDDYLRFREEMEAVGTMCKMRVRPPSGGFNTLTFESYPRKDRKKTMPKSKDDDYRLVTLRRPVVKKVEEKEDLSDLSI